MLIITLMTMIIILMMKVIMIMIIRINKYFSDTY